MTKIAVITDTHYGVRNDHEKFLLNMQKFTKNVFFPALKKHKVKHVIHLGDLVDRRKYVSFRTSKYLRQDFLEPLKDYDTHIIIGNHDTSYRGHHEINALYELVDGKYSNIKVYTTPSEVIFDGIKMLFVPWICDSNYTQTMQMLESTNAQIVMGHLELSGFEMYRGLVAAHGISRKLFDKFNLVCSGHFHHKSSVGNIHYLGAMSEHTWSDFDDDRGFHLFDTETRKLEFIKNPYSMFKKIWYDDREGTTPLAFSKKDYKDCIVKVVVTAKENPYLFDTFITKLEAAGAIDVLVVDDHLNLYSETTEEIDNTQDTISIFSSYVSQLDIEGVNKDKLYSCLINIYNEAQELR